MNIDLILLLLLLLLFLLLSVLQLDLEGLDVGGDDALSDAADIGRLKVGGWGGGGGGSGCGHWEEGSGGGGGGASKAGGGIHINWNDKTAKNNDHYYFLIKTKRWKGGPSVYGSGKSKEPGSNEDPGQPQLYP